MEIIRFTFREATIFPSRGREGRQDKPNNEKDDDAHRQRPNGILCDVAFKN
jgi:hypothetical protein